MNAIKLVNKQEVIENQQEMEFHFFWTTVSPFSQFHRSLFTVDGIEFTCMEQYMMYSKATFFGDTDTAQKILAIPYPVGGEREVPKQYKALGRAVSPFDKDQWDKESVNVVWRGNFHKFSQNADMKEQLMRPSSKRLVFVEASPYDTIWGIGHKEKDRQAKHPEQWRGKNRLGFILTSLRENFQSLEVK